MKKILIFQHIVNRKLAKCLILILGLGDNIYDLYNSTEYQTSICRKLVWTPLVSPHVLCKTQSNALVKSRNMSNFKFPSQCLFGWRPPILFQWLALLTLLHPEKKTDRRFHKSKYQLVAVHMYITNKFFKNKFPTKISRNCHFSLTYEKPTWATKGFPHKMTSSRLFTNLLYNLPPKHC